MLIDTHCHINFPQFKTDLEEVIGRALEKGILMITVGTDVKSSLFAVKLAEKNEGKIFAAAGFHPADANRFDFDEEAYEELAANSRIIAIGETGLDFYHEKSEAGRAKQKEIFKKHIDLAAKNGKPLIIHCREAYPDMLKILREAKKEYPNLKGVNHFFSGSESDLENVLTLDFYVSFAGVITFTSAYDEIAKRAPLDKILVETDAPYLTPAPNRGKRNEPSFVEFTARRLAEIKNVSFEQIAGQTTENAKELFGI